MSAWRAIHMVKTPDKTYCGRNPVKVRFRTRNIKEATCGTCLGAYDTADCGE